MKKYLICLVCFFFPSFMLRPVLRLLGCEIGKRVKIGFSIVMTSNIRLRNDVKIGHFNFIQIDSLFMDKSAYMNNFNLLRGPLDVILQKRAAIGKRNMLRRAPLGITHGKSELFLGELTKITAFHFVDLTKSVRFGDFSTLAGIKSQLWTHGYVHAERGAERFRVDGEICIGNNVYIGSGVLINPGVSVADTIHIGGNSTLSKDLSKPGMYVNQPLRWLDKSYDSIKSGLEKVEADGLVDQVYEK